MAGTALGLRARTLLAHPALPWLALAVALGLRLLAWHVAAPPQQDELSYQSTARWLIDQGQQRLFWPPVTGWLIALVFWICGPSVAAARLAWLALDLVNLALLGRLASGVSAATATAGAPPPARALRGLVMMGYALYLPAIGFAVQTTSEIPAVTLLLGSLLLLGRGDADAPANHAHLRAALAGLTAGALVLTRPSLALVPLALAIVLIWHGTGRGHGDGDGDGQRQRQRQRDDGQPDAVPSRRWQPAALLVAVAAVVPLAYVARNQWVTGQAVLAQNADYDFHRGNGPVYQEDLNLFWPIATGEQIAYRRLRTGGGTEPPMTATPAQMRDQTFAFIRTHPLLFARRALGRLARLTVPRTEHLALLGGEPRAILANRPALALLLLGAVQFAPLLALGTIGLVGLGRTDPLWARRCIAVLVGLIPPVLVTISKPRFGFVFEPLLLIAAAAFVLDAPAWRPLLVRPAVIAIGGFCTWAWLAWLVFAVTSRSS